MTSWLLGVIGIVFLGVLLEIVYPNGKTNVFCRGIFGIFAVAVMLSPILKLKNIDFDVNYVDETLVNNINDAKENYYKIKIEQVLKNNAINGAIVELEGKTTNNEYEIENIFIDTSELVLTENLTNINKYEVITQTILETIDIDKERIIVYG